MANKQAKTTQKVEKGEKAKLNITVACNLKSKLKQREKNITHNYVRIINTQKY